MANSASAGNSAASYLSQSSPPIAGDPNAKPFDTSKMEKNLGTTSGVASDSGNNPGQVSKPATPLDDCNTSVVPPFADVKINNDVTEWTAINNYGDSSFGKMSSTGAGILVDEKGTVKIRGAGPVAEDLTHGRVEITSQSNMRLNVGTSLSIDVNQSGKHNEDGDMSSSQSQSVEKKKYPAFSINVNNGGLDITCESGDIAFSGKNIILNASENITLNGTRAISLLAGFSANTAAIKAANSIGKLFGFELPVSGGGEVVIKAAKFINDTTTKVETASSTEAKSGGMNLAETGSSNGITSFQTSGDLDLSASGNVLLASGQKMRIEAQNSPVRLTGLGTPPLWAATQLEALAIAVNKKNVPTKTAFRVEVDSGDYITNVMKIGNYGVNTQNGSIGILSGNPAATFTGKPNDIILKSFKGDFIGESATGSAGLFARLQAGVGIGIPGKATDIVAVYSAGGNGGGSPGAIMRSIAGQSAMLGKTQVGMGIGMTPQASTNFLSFNPAGAIMKVTGPLTTNITGAVTTKITGANTTSITGANTFNVIGANTFNVTGANTANVTGANIANVTGLVASKSQTGVQIESPGDITIKSQGKIDMTAPGDITISGGTIKLN